MLNKRTNILFDENLWNKLNKYAKKNNLSVGQTVREAVKEKITSTSTMEQRKSTIQAILNHRPSSVKGKIDYKLLIDDGRKY